jgi:site-specific DNA-cytosine methylase
MRLLELFSGTKSVSNAVGDRFTEVVSLDILSKANPTICADILTWDYTVYPREYFDVIWASPPCTEYSVIRNCNPRCPRNLDLADRIVQKTLEIIDYFNPTKFYIENPQTGLLKDREFMQGLPYYDVDYCQYCNWGYRKRTRIWTSVLDFKPKLCTADCPNRVSVGGSHKTPIANTGMVHRLHSKFTTLSERHRIPPQLITSLFDAD